MTIVPESKGIRQHATAGTRTSADVLRHVSVRSRRTLSCVPYILVGVRLL